ncbi:sigma-70 family RNA polymerase sigma factor [Egibacter rhizosphaerae]|uniref:Sigma-70 family RNA polymerase sigma factor n=1 Tax=Egibacter rhizosphaerae TaxID=1670831 RepID=A0A411YC25_9ACTN|nr:sigma-70 family RNA polymerase sigma factor [Egibacter rhizosphaerae]QBI18712.1 sigma-70 family RNA polymerase sigma factor [Egibacter rhizosphaerae]
MTATEDELTGWAEAHRRELVAHCYRMLGSPFDAEDAVQETFARAWRRVSQYDARRGSPRTWLYGIATNVCIDWLRGRTRRARAEDLGPPTAPDAPLGTPLPVDRWVEPLPEWPVGHADEADPATVVTTRESVRLAFVAALQRLAPRQRAVLLLRDVLGWRAAETAELLGTTTAAVNSALQRARTTLADTDAREGEGGEPADPRNTRQRELLERYLAAFERFDVDALVGLLREDATMSMPPFAWWLAGREAIEHAWRNADGACDGTLLLPMVASGAPAFAQYVPDEPGGPPRPRAVVVLDTAGDRIRGMSLFLDTPRLFPAFGIPLDPEAVAKARDQLMPG